VSDIVLSVPIDANGVNPLLESLTKINETLTKINETSVSAFSQMSKGLDKPVKDVDKTNKKLKETHKTISSILDKIKVSGLMKMGAKVLTGGAALLGVSAGAMMFGAVMNADKNVQQGYESKSLGLTIAEMKGLAIASEKMYGDQGKLATALGALTTAMQSADTSGALATLGLNQQQLQSINPVNALAQVMDAIKGAPGDISSEYLKTAFQQVTGGAIDFNATIKEGSGNLKTFFNEFEQKYSGVDFDALQRSSQALIDFKAQLDIVSQKIGSKLAVPISELLEKLEPSLDKFAAYFGRILDSITQEDVDNFVAGIEKLFTILGKVAKVAWNTTEGVAGFIGSAAEDKGASEFAARDKAAKSGDVSGVIVNDLVGGLKQALGKTVEGIQGNLNFLGGTPEEQAAERQKAAPPGYSWDIKSNSYVPTPKSNTLVVPPKKTSPTTAAPSKTNIPVVPAAPKKIKSAFEYSDNGGVNSLSSGFDKLKASFNSNSGDAPYKTLDYHPTINVNSAREASDVATNLNKIIQIQGGV
jgi:hypothetical protein